MTRKLLLENVLSEDEIQDEIASFARHLKNPFVMNLVAPMGCGKSTFVRTLLYHFGLKQNVPVTSPTFTLMNDYNIGDKWFAHLDLYRLTGQPDMEEWGLLDTRNFHGMFIEWPEIIGSSEYTKIKPTHELHISYLDKDPDKREYKLFAVS
ncbi:MAG: tRNA (adenosine(37)-N6)-threonylcarbamoyltransferase complex ATPase subunit type 1 TsaE [Oligoflexales bacterium]